MFKPFEQWAFKLIYEYNNYFTLSNPLYLQTRLLVSFCRASSGRSFEQLLHNIINLLYGLVLSFDLLMLSIMISLFLTIIMAMNFDQQIETSSLVWKQCRIDKVTSLSYSTLIYYSYNVIVMQEIINMLGNNAEISKCCPKISVVYIVSSLTNPEHKL